MGIDTIGKQKAKNIKERLLKTAVKTKNILRGQKGEGYVDSAIRIIIGLVIGALILAGLYLLFKQTILPDVSDKTSSMFSYTG